MMKLLIDARKTPAAAQEKGMKWLPFFLVAILMALAPVTAEATSYYYLEQFGAQNLTASGWITNFSMSRDICITDANFPSTEVVVTTGGTTNALVLRGDPNRTGAMANWDQWYIGRGAIFRPVNNIAFGQNVTASEYDPFGFVVIRSNTFLHRRNVGANDGSDDDNNYGKTLLEFWMAEDNGAGGNYSRFNNFVFFYDKTWNNYNYQGRVSNVFGYFDNNENDLITNMWSNFTDPDGNVMNPRTAFIKAYHGGPGGTGTAQQCTAPLGIKMTHSGKTISIFLNLDPLEVNTATYKNSWIRWAEVPVAWSNKVVALFGLESPTRMDDQTNSVIITHFEVRSVANSLTSEITPKKILNNVWVPYTATLKVQSISPSDSGIGEVVIVKPAGFGIFSNLPGVIVSNTNGQLTTITTGTPGNQQVLVTTNTSGELVCRFRMQSLSLNQIITNGEIKVTFNTIYTNSAVNTAGSEFGIYGDCYKHFDTAQDIMFSGTGIPYATTGRKKGTPSSLNSTTVFAFSQPQARALVEYSPFPLVMGTGETAFTVKLFTETLGSPDIGSVRILIPSNSTLNSLNNFSVKSGQVTGSDLGVASLVTLGTAPNISNFIYIDYSGLPSGGMPGYNGFDKIQFTVSNTPAVPVGYSNTNYLWQVEVNSANIVAGSTWQLATNGVGGSISNHMILLLSSNAILYNSITPSKVAIYSTNISNNIRYAYTIRNAGSPGNNVQRFRISIPSLISNVSVSNFMLSNATLTNIIPFTNSAGVSQITNTNDGYIWVNLAGMVTNGRTNGILSNGQTFVLYFNAMHTNTNVNSTEALADFTCYADNGNGANYTLQFQDAPKTWGVSIKPPNPLGENRLMILSGTSTNAPVSWTSDVTNIVLNEIVNLSPKGVPVKIARMELATNLFPNIISYTSTHIANNGANIVLSNGQNGTNYISMNYFADANGNLLSFYDNGSEKDVVTVTVVDAVTNPLTYVPTTLVYKTTDQGTAVITNDYMPTAQASVTTNGTNSIIFEYPPLLVKTELRPSQVDTTSPSTNYTNSIINLGDTGNRIYYSYINIPDSIGTNVYNVHSTTLPSTVNDAGFDKDNKRIVITYSPYLDGGQTNIVTFTMDDIVTNLTLYGVSFSNYATNDRDYRLMTNGSFSVDYLLPAPRGGSMISPNVVYASSGETAGTVLTQMLQLRVTNTGTGSDRFYSLRVDIPSMLYSNVNVVSNLYGNPVTNDTTNIWVNYTNAELLAGKGDIIFIRAMVSNVPNLPTNGLWTTYAANGSDEAGDFYFELTNVEPGSRYTFGTERMLSLIDVNSPTTELTNDFNLYVTNGGAGSLPVKGLRIEIPYPYTSISTLEIPSGQAFTSSVNSSNILIALNNQLNAATGLQVHIKAVKPRLHNSTNANWRAWALYTNTVTNAVCDGYLDAFRGSNLQSIYLPNPNYTAYVEPNQVGKDETSMDFDVTVINDGEEGNNLYRLTILPPTNALGSFTNILTNIAPVSSLYGVVSVSNDGSVVVDYLANGTNLSSGMQDTIRLIGYDDVNSVRNDIPDWQVLSVNATNILQNGVSKSPDYLGKSLGLEYIVPAYDASFTVYSNIINSTVAVGSNVVLKIENTGSSLETNNILSMRVYFPYPVTNIQVISNLLSAKSVLVTNSITNGTNYLEYAYTNGTFAPDSNDQIFMNVYDSLDSGETNCQIMVNARFNTSAQTYVTAKVLPNSDSSLKYVMPTPAATITIASNLYTTQTNKYVSVSYSISNRALDPQNMLEKVWIQLDPMFISNGLAMTLTNLVTNNTQVTNISTGTNFVYVDINNTTTNIVSVTNVTCVTNFAFDGTNYSLCFSNFISGVNIPMSLLLYHTNNNEGLTNIFITEVTNSKANAVYTNYLSTVKPPSAGFVSRFYDTTRYTNTMSISFNNNTSGTMAVQRIRITPTNSIFTNILAVTSSGATSNTSSNLVITYPSGLGKGVADSITVTVADNLGSLKVQNNVPWRVEADNGTGWADVRELTVGSLKVNLTAPAPDVQLILQSNVIYSTQTNRTVRVGIFLSNRGAERNEPGVFSITLPLSFQTNIVTASLQTNGTSATNADYTTPGFFLKLAGFTNGIADLYNLDLYNTNDVDLGSNTFTFLVSNSQYATNISAVLTVVRPPSAAIVSGPVDSTVTSNTVMLSLKNDTSTNLYVQSFRITPPTNVFTNVISAISAKGGVVSVTESNLTVTYNNLELPRNEEDTVTVQLQNLFSNVAAINGVAWKVEANSGTGYGEAREYDTGLRQNVVTPAPYVRAGLVDSTIYASMTNRVFRAGIAVTNLGSGLNRVDTMWVSVPLSFQTNLDTNSLETNNTVATNVDYASGIYRMEFTNMTNGISSLFYLNLFNTNDNDQINYPLVLTFSNGVYATNVTLSVSMVKAPQAGLSNDTVDSMNPSNFVALTLNNKVDIAVQKVRITAPASLFSGILSATNTYGGAVFTGGNQMIVTYASGLPKDGQDTLKIWAQNASQGLFITNGVPWQVEVDNGTGWADARELTTGALLQNVTAPSPDVLVIMTSNVLYTSQTNQTVRLGLEVVNRGAGKNEIRTLTIGVDPTYRDGMADTSLVTNGSSATNLLWTGTSFLLTMENFTNGVTNWYSLDVLNTNELDQGSWTFPVVISNGAFSQNANQAVSLCRAPSAGLSNQSVDSSIVTNIVKLLLNNNATAVGSLPVYRFRVTPPAGLFNPVDNAVAATGNVVNNGSDVTINYPAGLDKNAVDTLTLTMSFPAGQVFQSSGHDWTVEADNGTGWALIRESSVNSLKMSVTAPDPSPVLAFQSNIIYTTRTNGSFVMGFSVSNAGIGRNNFESLILTVDPALRVNMGLSNFITNGTESSSVTWDGTSYWLDFINFEAGSNMNFALELYNTNNVDQDSFPISLQLSNAVRVTSVTSNLYLVKPPSAALFTASVDSSQYSNRIDLSLENNTTAAGDLPVRRIRIVPPDSVYTNIMSGTVSNGTGVNSGASFEINYPAGLSKGEKSFVTLWVANNQVLLQTNGLVWYVEADNGTGYAAARESSIGALAQSMTVPAATVTVDVFSNRIYASQTNAFFRMGWRVINNGSDKNHIRGMEFNIEPSFTNQIALSRLRTNGTYVTNINFDGQSNYRLLLNGFSGGKTNWFYMDLYNTNNQDSTSHGIRMAINNGVQTTNMVLPIEVEKAPSAGLVTPSVDSSLYSNRVDLTIVNNTSAADELPIMRVRIVPPASVYSNVQSGATSNGSGVNAGAYYEITYTNGGLLKGAQDNVTLWVANSQVLLQTNGLEWLVEADNGTGYGALRETANGALRQAMTVPAASVTVDVFSNRIYTSQTNAFFRMGWRVINTGSDKNHIRGMELNVEPSFTNQISLSRLVTNGTLVTNVLFDGESNYRMLLSGFSGGKTNWYYMDIYNTNAEDSTNHRMELVIDNGVLATNINLPIAVVKTPTAGLATNSFDSSTGSNLMVLNIYNTTTAEGDLPVYAIRVTPPAGLLQGVQFSNSAANGIVSVGASDFTLNYPAGISKGGQDTLTFWTTMASNTLMVTNGLQWRVEADSGTGFGLVREVSSGALLQAYTAPAPSIGIGISSNVFYTSQTNQKVRVAIALTNLGADRNTINSMQITVDTNFQLGLAVGNLVTNMVSVQSVSYASGVYTVNFPDFTAGSIGYFSLDLTNTNDIDDRDYLFPVRISNATGETNVSLQVFLVKPPSAGLAVGTFDSTTVSNSVAMTIDNNTTYSGSNSIYSVRITPPAGVFSAIKATSLTNPTVTNNTLAGFTFNYPQGLYKGTRDQINIGFVYSNDQYETNDLVWKVEVNSGNGYGAAREISQGSLLQKLIIPSPALSNRLQTGWYMINLGGKVATNHFAFQISNAGSGMNYIVSNLFLLPAEMSAVIPSTLSNSYGKAQMSVNTNGSTEVLVVYTNGRGLMPGEVDEVSFSFVNTIMRAGSVSVDHTGFNRSRLPQLTRAKVDFLAEAEPTEGFVKDQMVVFSIDHFTNVNYQINNGMYDLKILKLRMQFDNTQLLVTNIKSTLFGLDVPFTTTPSNIVIDYTQFTNGIPSKLGYGGGKETLVLSLLYTNSTSWTNAMAADVLFENTEDYQLAKRPNGENDFLPVLVADFGRLAGRVLPQNVTPIVKLYYPGGSVQITNRYGDKVEVGASSLTGDFLVDFVPGGTWDVGFSGVGYKESRVSNVTVSNNAVATLTLYKMKRELFNPSATGAQTTGSLDDTNTLVVFPAGTVTENFSLDIWVTNVNSIAGMKDKTKGGTITTPAVPDALNIYQFEISGLTGNSLIGQTLGNDVVIQLHYNPADITTQGWDENLIAIYYWKELTGEWVRVGGTVDKVRHTVTAKVNYLHRYYAILGETVSPIVGANGFVSVKVEPKVFTPTSDNRLVNAIRISIGFDPTVTESDFEVRIYDVFGKLHRTFKRSAEYKQGEVYWDGKDSEGFPVKSGVYVYRVVIGSNVYSGTIVIAR